jgi:hypothetical protein
VSALGVMLAFASMDEAAVAALAECKQQTQTVECGGVIYRGADGYYASFAFDTRATNQSVSLETALALHPDAVADFHTHVCIGHHELVEVFSQQDVMVDKGLHLVGYMLSLCSGYVRRWAPGDPDDDFEVDFSSGRKLFLATGHIVGIVQ